MSSGDAAVFLDKDGTLIENVPYNVDPARIRLSPGASEALASLSRSAFRLIVVSNQPGVALGLFPERALRGVNACLRELLAQAGARLDAFYYCPHFPEGKLARYSRACDCRKPGPGMLLRAAQERGVDLTRSWMIGDILDDIEAGRRAGCRTVLIDNGNETEWQLAAAREPHYIAADLREASAHVLRPRAQATAPASPDLCL
jgi:D-glycero-D-manno-heptose 1,7-bisphosphate phosphatase